MIPVFELFESKIRRTIISLILMMFLPKGSVPADEQKADSHIGQKQESSAVQEAFERIHSIKPQLENLDQPDSSDLLIQMEELPFESILDQLVASELETNRQVGVLNERIQRLLKQARENLVEQAARSTAPGAEQAAETPASDTAAANTQETENSVPAENEDEAGQADASGPDAVPVPTKLDPAAQKILSDPPDQLALANNLFETGEIELARDLYREIVDDAQPVNEKLWVRYQLAGCNRRLAEMDIAKTQYRELANNTTDHVLVKSARWWLDAIEKRARVASLIELTRQSIEQRNQEPVDESEQ